MRENKLVSCELFFELICRDPRSGASANVLPLVADDIFSDKPDTES